LQRLSKVLSAITESTPKKNTIRNYAFILSRLETFFRNRLLSSISPDDILSFLNLVTDGCRQSTKKLRYANLKSFFNFIKDAIDPTLKNPCESTILKKAFKDIKPDPWVFLDKETVDEIIFRTENQRNRLMLELMARGGLRISEVLKLRVANVQERKLILKTPKSGKESEVAYIPKKVADRLSDYILKKEIDPKERVIPLSYTAARLIVVKSGKMVGIHLRPHDLRRHAATYASRAGTPIEIVSKILLRHSNLSTTQRYLGKVSEIEALRWMDQLYG